MYLSNRIPLGYGFFFACQNQYLLDVYVCEGLFRDIDISCTDTYY